MPTGQYQMVDGGRVVGPESKFDLGNVLLEIKNHARGGPASSSTTQLEQISTGDRGSILSLFSAKGIYQLKDKWITPKQTLAIKKRSLFISSNGKYIAVADGDQLTVMQEDDGYLNPCGNHTSSDRTCIFRFGGWLEPDGILGVVDHTNTVYFIGWNGEEISTITSRELNISSQVIGLFVWNYMDSNETTKNIFCAVALDGSFHHIEISKEPNVRVCSSSDLSHCFKLNNKISSSVACMGFNEDLSLVGMVSAAPGNTVNSPGSHILYLLRLTMKFQFELLLCSPIRGTFSASRSNAGPPIDAKLLISPRGKYVAALDMNGNLDVYSIDYDTCSLSVVCFDNKSSPRTLRDEGNGKGFCLMDIADFTWWSAHVLLFTTRRDTIKMLDLCTGMELLEKDLELSKPVLERAGRHQGFVFALGSQPLKANSSSENSDAESTSNTSPENIQHCDAECIGWSLMSLSEKSVEEMYDILVQKREYKSAVDFASRFDLDKDKIFKSQWKNSCQGVGDLNMFLSNIKDLDFVLLECLNSVPQTEDDITSLLSYGLLITDQFKFLEAEDDKSNPIWKYRKLRLQLLQYRDRLETFLGVNMGRYFATEYSRFRALPLSESAKALAETGKIGALNLLFKRHPYSLASNMLDVLSAIPETVPVLSYGQLLPGRLPSDSFSLRDEDWVECSQMATYLTDVDSGLENNPELQTEHILKCTVGVVWPIADELSEWYRNRSLEIDNLSGQVDNCLALIEFACRKGIVELQLLLEDITYLQHLIFSNDLETHFFMSLAHWQQLSDYEKFKMMIDGVKSEKLVKRLREKAIPFMLSRPFYRTFEISSPSVDAHSSADADETFVVRWLKEVAAGNQLDTCLAVIEEGCSDLSSRIFSNSKEAVETTIECLYLCTLTDCWHGMASILSKLPSRSPKVRTELVANGSTPGNGNQGSESPISPGHLRANVDYINIHGGEPVQGRFSTSLLSEELEMRVKNAEGHVEAGRLLAYYQVPKPMVYFQSAHLDEKGVKQLLRLILSKFSRRQPGKSDTDWANMWSDMLILQEKAFSFIDKEYILIEFCRGLLKSGKFSLARNYLKGNGNIALTAEKAESLVIQAAREYFFSASTLACSEIFMAKECLNLLSHSDSAKAESDIIDALTINLPSLGVTILPVQFKQIRNPMEVINMVIRSQREVYLDVDELIELGKLFGLRSQEDVSAIQEAVAREAAVAGDLQLSFELCLALAKKGYGPIWDLASAIARGPVLDNMDTVARRQLLGFSLSYCDEESIGELLQAWKEIDMQIRQEKLIFLSETEPPTSSVCLSASFRSEAHSNLNVSSVSVETSTNEAVNDDQVINGKKNILLTVVKDPEKLATWDHFLKENAKTSSFVVSQLPWLLELTKKSEYNSKSNFMFKSSIEKCLMSVRMQAALCILSWLAENNLGPKDDLIATLADISMEFSARGGGEEDFIGLSFLLNLYDAYHAVEIIDGQLRRREAYQELQNVMNTGMLYSNLQSSVMECSNADCRRMLLLCRINEKQPRHPTDTAVGTNDVTLTFWKDWKSKLEAQRQISEQARELEQIIPGVESARFLSGDKKFIEDSILSFIDMVKFEKKHIIREVTNLADTYGLSRTKVLIHYFSCCLVSEHWTNEEILAEFSVFREDLVKSAKEIISMIYSTVYPEIQGENKKRLSCIYSILSACYKRLKKFEDFETEKHEQQDHVHPLELFHFYQILESECNRISSIDNLNFKRICGLYDLNFESFNDEACKHISEFTVEPLADMVHTLASIYPNRQALGLVSRSDVYKKYVLMKLAALEDSFADNVDPLNSESYTIYLAELEKHYDNCRDCIRALSSKEDARCMIGKFFSLSIIGNVPKDLSDEQIVKLQLIELLNFWIRLTADIPEDTPKILEEQTNNTVSSHLSICLTIFRRLVMENEISVNQGWNTVLVCYKVGLINGPKLDVSLFYKAMVISGCGFREIQVVSAEEKSQNSDSTVANEYLVHLYVETMNSCVNEFLNGSGNWYSVSKLLQSLSTLTSDNANELQLIRLKIWEILNHFSDSMQVPRHERVYALELMQSISGRNSRNHVEGFPSVEPWEGWHDPWAESRSVECVAHSRVINNLVALRSTELLANISPMLRVTSDDLSSADSAVSCFMVIVDGAASAKDFEILQAVLLEWDEVFSSQMAEKSSEFPATNWSSEEWDEGWENLAEEPLNEVEAEASTCLHPLHVCWTAMIKKLITLSLLQVMIKLVDQSLMKTRFILLDETEVNEIVQLLMEIDCFIVIKITFLFPYENLWFRSLRCFEDKLKLQVLPSRTYDSEMLMLILSSGVLPHIATDPAYCSVFSDICYLVGYLSHSCQEDVLNHPRARNDSLTVESDLYCQLLLPCFVAELVVAGKYLLAGHLISQWMHIHSTFTCVNIVAASLAKYLEGLLQKQPYSDCHLEVAVSHSSLPNTCSKLRKKMKHLLESSLSSVKSVL